MESELIVMKEATNVRAERGLKPRQNSGRRLAQMLEGIWPISGHGFSCRTGLLEANGATKPGCSDWTKWLQPFGESEVIGTSASAGRNRASKHRLRGKPFSLDMFTSCVLNLTKNNNSEEVLRQHLYNGHGHAQSP